MKTFLLSVLVIFMGLGFDARAAVTNAPASEPPPGPAPPLAAPTKHSGEELERLVMPIALHPDPLISVILPASVYPVEVVMAARFVKNTNNIPKIDSQPWDDSVKAVAKFPEIIAQMDAQLDWTVELGQAFLEQRQELMTAIQALRLKARQAGTLETTPEQVITVTNELQETVSGQGTVMVTNTIVQIEPSDPQVIYVPTYTPAAYYPPWDYGYGYPYYGYASPYYGYYRYGYPYYAYDYYPYYAPWISFGAGVFLGSSFVFFNDCDWHSHDIHHHGHGHGGMHHQGNFQHQGRSTIARAGQPEARLSQGTGSRDAVVRQSWQPDQRRLQRSGVASARMRDVRGDTRAMGAASPMQGVSRGATAQRSQQARLSGSQQSAVGPQGQTARPASSYQGSRAVQRAGNATAARAAQTPGTIQRPSTAQGRANLQSPSTVPGRSAVTRPPTTQRPSTMQRSPAAQGPSTVQRTAPPSTFNRNVPQRSSGFSGAPGGGGTRNFSGGGSVSRGSGGFSSPRGASGFNSGSGAFRGSPGFNQGSGGSRGAPGMNPGGGSFRGGSPGFSQGGGGFRGGGGAVSRGGGGFSGGGGRGGGGHGGGGRR